jgi:cyclophilin family peptidyl-prolyl cis-trans isomerase
MPHFGLSLVAAVPGLFAAVTLGEEGLARRMLLDPSLPAVNRRAPEAFHARLDTSQGTIVLEIRREWAPHGVDRFFNLADAGYYDGARFFRVVEGRWAQFGVHGDPAVSQAWRDRTIPDDPRRLSNLRGTIAFAFAVPGGRATQVFFNLRDNSDAFDKEPFVPFGRIVEGIEVLDRLNSEYGERAGGGIRAGRQAPLFEGGNAWLAREFPRLDFVRKLDVEP